MDTLDKTDILILKALQENGRITVKDLALKVHLSPTPVFERMHRLKREATSSAIPPSSVLPNSGEAS